MSFSVDVIDRVCSPSFSLPTSKITNPDVTGIINSSVIQAAVRPASSKVTKRPWTQHKNPLTNKGVLYRLNPYAKTIRRQELREYGGIPDLMFFSLFFSQTGTYQGEEGEEAKDPKLRQQRVHRHLVCSLRWADLYALSILVLLLFPVWIAFMNACRATTVQTQISSKA